MPGVFGNLELLGSFPWVSSRPATMAKAADAKGEDAEKHGGNGKPDDYGCLSS